MLTDAISTKILCAGHFYHNMQTFGLFMLSYMGLVARKPVFGVSDKASFKPVSQLHRLAKKLKFHL